MNQWAFVVGAYVLVVLSVGALTLTAWSAMRRAEADADAVKRR